MLNKMVTVGKKAVRQGMRHLFALLPRQQRFNLIRSFAHCDPAPTRRLVLKIADTQEELEACFKLLHDAYVESGFMKPDPSGMRVTIYHALPTTTTLCAKFNGEVVGTLSLIRESVLGVPLQRIFDLSEVREKEGLIAEVSALAVRRDFRTTGGSILFPLMKFMYEYCTTFFDTRHLVIAVNPRHIEMYESLLFFERLTANVVENYDFVNGAPAVGAALDLKKAPDIFRQCYDSKPSDKNLYKYFTQVRMPNILFPNRRFFTTNDPVLTPELIDYFFNVRTNVFKGLSDRKKLLLHSIYDLPAYRPILPSVADDPQHPQVRRHQRFSVKCPATVVFPDNGTEHATMLEIVEVSRSGFQGCTTESLPLNVWFNATIRLGRDDTSHVLVQAVHTHSSGKKNAYGFSLGEPDLVWKKFVSALYRSMTSSDLEAPTRFMF